MKLQRRAIWMAVFCLSPVNIQKLIPACLSVSIVSGTPSYHIRKNIVIYKGYQHTGKNI